MERYFNNSDNVKRLYNFYKPRNLYVINTSINSGSGGDHPLTNNKFNTKNNTGFTYKELTNYKYNNIYAFEILPSGKYRTLNVIRDIN